MRSNKAGGHYVPLSRVDERGQTPVLIGGLGYSPEWYNPLVRVRYIPGVRRINSKERNHVNDD